MTAARVCHSDYVYLVADRRHAKPSGLDEQTLPEEHRRWDLECLSMRQGIGFFGFLHTHRHERRSAFYQSRQ
jgi:hypothetical protein